MKEEYTNQEKETIEALQHIKDVPERSQARIESGKTAFLAQAEEILTQIKNQPVSISPFRRLINSLTQPKPQLRLSTLTISIILVSILLVTFSGSVYAARYALPDQTLYPYKLWLEDRRLALTQQTDSQIDLHLSFADERLREAQTLELDPEDPLSAQVFDNYQGHVEAANRLLAGLEGKNGQLDRLDDIQTRYQQLVEPEDSEDDVDTEDLEAPEEDEDDATEFEEADDEDRREEKEGIESAEDPEDEEESSEPDDDTESSSDSEDELDDSSDSSDSGESDDGEESDDSESPDDGEEPDDSENPESTEEPDSTDEPDDEEPDS